MLTDLNMPKLDGFELRGASAGTSATPGSGTDRCADRERHAGRTEQHPAAGMDDFAAKPTTIPFLAGKLHRWLPHLEWANRPDTGSGGAEGLDTQAAAAAANGPTS